MYRIFLVEDDRGIADAIAAQTALWDMETVCVKDFRSVMAEFAACAPQLLLLDVSLPFFDGYHWCREIRSVSKVPVIFISSAADNMNIVMAMNMGADDFIAKPFDQSVLMAKINALLRRTGMELKRNRISFRDLELHVLERRALRGGRDLELTPREYEILEYMVRNANRTLSLGQILKDVWKCSAPPLSTIVETRLCLLRKKLRRNGRPDLIHTLRGFGYVLK